MAKTKNDPAPATAIEKPAPAGALERPDFLPPKPSLAHPRGFE